MPALSKPTRPSAPRPFSTGMFPPSASSAGCRVRSCMTTPSWRWPASWAMADASARAALPSCSRTTCSSTALAGQVRATTRARSRAWSVMLGATTWCPEVPSFAALNAYLEQRCLARLDDRLREHTQSIGERLERDLEALQPLPASPYDPCDRRPARVSSLSLVRYDRNDYSVPTAYGHRPVLVRGYVDEVVIACGAEIIARHPRSYEREDFIFEPRHYLALLEHKIGALDQAAPLQGWELPEVFGTLRRLLEARMGKAGKREYVQVLRLLETFRLEDVHAAVREALRLEAIGFDAVKHLVLCRIERRPPKLDLAAYPYLPRVTVATTSAKAYLALLGGTAA